MDGYLGDELCIGVGANQDCALCLYGFLLLRSMLANTHYSSQMGMVSANLLTTVAGLDPAPDYFLGIWPIYSLCIQSYRLCSAAAGAAVDPSSHSSKMG